MRKKFYLCVCHRKHVWCMYTVYMYGLVRKIVRDKRQRVKQQTVKSKGSVTFCLVTKRLVSKCLVTKRLVTKCLHYKMPTLQNAYVTKCLRYKMPSYKMPTLQNAYVTKCLYVKMPIIFFIFFWCKWSLHFGIFFILG